MVCSWCIDYLITRVWQSIRHRRAKGLNAGDGILYTYIGISVGGIFAGILSQITKSRKLTMMIFLLSIGCQCRCLLECQGITSHQFIWLCFFMGCSVGYWATFVTIAAEQFGTNIRSTVLPRFPILYVVH